MKRKAKLAYALAANGERTLATLYLRDLLLGGDRFRTYLESNEEARYIVCDVLDFRMWVDLLDEGLSRDLLMDGVREPLASAKYREELARLEAERGGLTVVEVGANIGYFTLLFLAGSRAGGRVVAFEPLPDNFALLQENVRLNGFEDAVDCHQYAIGAESKATTMQVSTHSNLATVAESTPRSHYVGEIGVSMRSLDEFLASDDVRADSVDVLRMDLQGYEYEVFQGMSELLRSGTVGLAFLEIHPWYLKERDVYDRFLSMLREAGFELVFAADGRTDTLREDKHTYEERELTVDSIDELRDVPFTVEVILRRR